MNMDLLKQIALTLLRVVAGLLFLQAGGMKLFDWFGGIPAEFGGHPPLLSQTWIGGVLEFYGGVAILLGLFTRPVAFILSGEMAVAYFQFHQPNGAWPIQNHGEPAVLLCFIFLPDFVPILGYLDDLILLPLFIALAIKMVPDPVMDECRKRAREIPERETGESGGRCNHRYHLADDHGPFHNIRLSSNHGTIVSSFPQIRGGARVR